jgi:DNA processing protein
MNRSYRDIILHLSLIPGVGPDLIKYMTKDYTFSLHHDIYRYSQSDFMRLFFLTERKAQLVYLGLARKDLLERELELLALHRINFVTPYDEDYPVLLKVNSSFPEVIYVQSKDGMLGLNQKICLSVVSSRKTNRYGKKVIFDMIRGLGSQKTENLCIVSGGAIGGDTFAHEAALEAGIKTVSILGSGLLSWYPKCNTALFEKIIDNGGVLISHFSLETSASPKTFPARNALIAGLSQATLVIQAGSKSGTLITAHYALEYGRSVGTIPGQIDDPLMIESNNLLKQGASCITDVSDLFSLLNITTQKIAASHGLCDKQYLDCSQIGHQIISMCYQPISFEEILLQFDLSRELLYQELVVLLSKGYIKEDVLGCYYVA